MVPNHTTDHTLPARNYCFKIGVLYVCNDHNVVLYWHAYSIGDTDVVWMLKSSDDKIVIAVLPSFIVNLMSTLFRSTLRKWFGFKNRQIRVFYLRCSNIFKSMLHFITYRNISFCLQGEPHSSISLLAISKQYNFWIRILFPKIIQQYILKFGWFGARWALYLASSANTCCCQPAAILHDDIHSNVVVQLN